MEHRRHTAQVDKSLIVIHWNLLRSALLWDIMQRVVVPRGGSLASRMTTCCSRFHSVPA